MTSLPPRPDLFQIMLAAMQKQNQHLSTLTAVLIVGLSCIVLLLLLLVLGPV